ncbi:MAG TPA: hypothetical protein DG577_00965 [Firmicutes bacterium]|nr:hypothetical protein [Bacillota bacterium]HCX77962.1 hypothetical protein [Bacillota bacterium]
MVAGFNSAGPVELERLVFYRSFNWNSCWYFQCILFTEKDCTLGVKQVDYFTKVRQISLRAASIAFILAALAAISGRWPVAFGVLIGFLVALVNFRLLAQSIPKLLELPFQAARKGAAVRYILRYVLTISALLIVNANPNLNVWAAFVGLVLIKAVILGKAVFIFAQQKFQSCLNSARWERGDK